MKPAERVFLHLPMSTQQVPAQPNKRSHEGDRTGNRSGRRQFVLRIMMAVGGILLRGLLAPNSQGGINNMGSISVACYRSKPGREVELLALVRNHLPPLRAEGLVTARTPIIMRSADGTVIEIFEWVSPAAIEGAHDNPVVRALWKKFEAVCTFETPSNIKEFQSLFAHFEPI